MNALRLNKLSKPVMIALAVIMALSLSVLGLGVSNAATSATSAGPPVTIYGCVVGSSRTLEHVFTVQSNFLASGGCTGVGGFEVTVGANGAVTPPPTPTPTPTQTTPTPTPTPTTPTPTPTQTNPSTFSCMVTTNGNCPSSGSYDSDLAGGANQSALVTQDEWNITPALKSQVLSANGTGNWQVTANLSSGNTAVLSYPDSQDTVNSWTAAAGSKPIPVGNYTSLKSTYSTVMPSDIGKAGSSDDYEAAYDLWLGSTAGASWANDQEIMVWTDNHGQTPAGSDTGKTWTDASTGKVYEIWVDSGSSSVSTNNDIVTFVAKSNAQSGSVDLLALYKFLQSGGYTAANAGVDQMDYGFELCSTSGVTQTFAVNGYTLTAAGSGI